MLGRIFVVNLCAVVLLTGYAVCAVGQPAVTNVRTGEHVGLTRVVLDVTEAVEFRTFTLADPYRVVVDLPGLEWRVLPDEAHRRGLISTIRFGYFEHGVSRMVIEANGPVEVRRAFVLPPQGNWAYRFVIDLAPVGSGSLRQFDWRRIGWCSQITSEKRRSIRRQGRVQPEKEKACCGP